MQNLLARSFTILRGLVYAAAFVWLWTWLALSVMPFDAELSWTLPSWLRPIGFLLASAGATLALTCIAIFVTRGRGTPAPFDPPREFVASGPYRYVRNPMYVGATAVLFGAALAQTSLSIALLALAFLLIMHMVVILYEEPALTEKFGASYLEYRARVHRWTVSMPKGGEKAGGG